MLRRSVRRWNARQIANLALAITIPLFAFLTRSSLGSFGATPTLAQSASAPLTLLWNAPKPSVTTSLAWGDLNNDGDLDLAFGNYDEPSQIYRNCTLQATDDSCSGVGLRFVPDTTWNPSPVTPVKTNDIAWGDLDGDGDLDLVLANKDSNAQIYLNTGTGLPSSASITLPSVGSTVTSLAIGDVDGTSGPDILLGVDAGPSLLFLNNGNRTFTLASNWGPTDEPATKDVAMGDINNDGNLDIILANSGEVSQLYLNINGSGTFSLSGWVPSSFASTTSIALGDLDGLNGLDIVLGNNGVGAQIYLNTPSGLPNNNTVVPPLGSATTLSVALGDSDRDGDLDLALGNGGQASQLYHNDGASTFTPDFNWKPSSSNQIEDLAWGDADGDGSLDLAMGNKSLVSQIYRNEGAALTQRTLGGEDLTAEQRKAALADVDNDGDLDLALGNKNKASQLYLNAGDGTFGPPAWSSPSALTNALAWGDVNNDGDLDLVLGNNGFSTLYRNDSTTGSINLTLEASWSPPSANTNAVAWGDLNNDGWLDLVLGNTGAASQIYLNNIGALSQTALLINPGATISTTTSVALGDINNDGDLDLVLGNSQTNGNQLYRNCTYPDKNFTCAAGALFVQDTSFIPAPFDTMSVALGDLNGDSRLDLIVGNLGNPNQIYWNDGRGTLTLDTVWRPAPADTNLVSLGDMDGDQDLDLLLSNQSQASQIYRNDGGGRLTLLPASTNLGLIPPTTTFAKTTGSTWGDLNGDGSLDIVLANITNSASQIYLNGTGEIATPINHAPTLRIRQPTVSGNPGPAGSLLSTGQIINSTTITFTYTLRDSENDRVGSVRGFFSLDGGGTWQQATPISTTLTPTRDIAPGDHMFSWDVFGSSFFGQSDSVLFQLRAYPLPVPSGLFSIAKQLSGPYQQPFVSASTTLFRARGRQVQVLNGASGTTPAQGAIVYRVPAGQERGDLLASADGQPFFTDVHGYLSGRATLNPQDRLAALLPVALPDNSELKAKVELFYTSPISSTSGLPDDTVQRGSSGSGIQVLRVASSHPLMLFNLTVGLEWDASNDPQYISQLQYNLRRASELLYDWTDGQAALGRLTVTYGADSVDRADIHIYATNRLRPWAYQGGVVSNPYTDTLTVPPATAPKTVVYTPGYLSMGAVWSRYGDSVSFGDDWPRALAHEVGHYALFLDDNYIGRDGSQLISITGCPGAMSDPYRDDYTEFHPTPAWTPACAQTLSNVETARSDWATIKRFYDSSAPGFTLRAPDTFNANPGPFAQALNFTQITLPTSTQPSAALSAPVFSLVRVPDRSKPYLTESYSYAPGSRVRAVLYTDQGRRLIDLGRPNMDQLIARGAQVGDTICVYDPTNLVAGCTTVEAGVAQIKLYDQTGWQPDIQINPLSGTQIEVIVPARGGIPGATSLQAQFFNKTLPLTATTNFTLSLLPGDTSYRGRLTLSQPVYGGYLRVGTNTPPSAAGWYESITEYQLNGIPVATPGAVAKVAPTSQIEVCNGVCPTKITRTPGAPVAVSSDGQMLIYGEALTTGQFYSLQTSTYLPPAPPWSILVGQAYRLYTKMTTSDLLAKHVAITAAYLESELPAGTEGGLAIYYTGDGASWKRLPTSRFDPNKNEISVSAVNAGLYGLISRIEVVPGWNTISYPWPGTFDVITATKKLNISPGRHFTTIHSYDPQDPNNNVWKVHDVDVPDWVNDLKTLSYGKGYWFIVPPGGGTPSLLAGAATPGIGVPVPPATFYGVLPYHSAPAQVGLPVQAISGGIVCSTSQTKLVSGAQVGFLIEVLPAGQGAPAGCGINGQPVTVTVGGQVIGQATWDNSRPITFRDIFLPFISTISATSAPATGGSSGTGGGGGSGGNNNDERWIGGPLP